MGWVSERWKAFTSAAGVRRYVIGGIITLAIALFDLVRPLLEGVGMTALVGMPSWALAIIVALGLIAFWLLERLVKLERQIKGARLELARLRTDGVALRNEGRGFLGTEPAWPDWEKRVLQWNDDVIANIKKINEADAEWFSVLDVVPPPRLKPHAYPGSDGHNKLYPEHDFRLKRLGEMIYSVWERASA